MNGIYFRKKLMNRCDKLYIQPNTRNLNIEGKLYTLQKIPSTKKVKALLDESNKTPE